MAMAISGVLVVFHDVEGMLACHLAVDQNEMIFYHPVFYLLAPIVEFNVSPTG